MDNYHSIAKYVYANRYLLISTLIVSVVIILIIFIKDYRAREKTFSLKEKCKLFYQIPFIVLTFLFIAWMIIEIVWQVIRELPLLIEGLIYGIGLLGFIYLISVVFSKLTKK